MVVQNSISFAAPSQLRFHMVADTDGNALIAVLNAYNQPIHNFHHLLMPMANLEAFLAGSTEPIVASNETCTCTFNVGHDSAHKNIDVVVEEPSKWQKLSDHLIIDEVRELVEHCKSSVSGAAQLT